MPRPKRDISQKIAQMPFGGFLLPLSGLRTRRQSFGRGRAAKNLTHHHMRQSRGDGPVDGNFGQIGCNQFCAQGCIEMQDRNDADPVAAQLAAPAQVQGPNRTVFCPLVAKHCPGGIVIVFNGARQNPPEGGTAPGRRPGFTVRRQNPVDLVAALNCSHARQKAGVAQTSPLKAGGGATFLGTKADSCQQSVLERPGLGHLQGFPQPVTRGRQISRGFNVDRAIALIAGG